MPNGGFSAEVGSECNTMSDAIITYLYSCQPALVEHYNETMHARPDQFPTYSTWDSEMLHRRGNLITAMLIRAIESGDFEEIKTTLHQTFSARLRSGFEPNELLRHIDLVNMGLLKTIESAPTSDQELRQLYIRRTQAEWQVAKMYVAMLNLQIPKEERNEIDPSLLELVAAD